MPKDISNLKKLDFLHTGTIISLEEISHLSKLEELKVEEIHVKECKEEVEVKFAETLKSLVCTWSRVEEETQNEQNNQEQVARYLPDGLIQHLHRFKQIRSFSGYLSPKKDDVEWIGTHFPLEKECEMLPHLEFLESSLTNKLGVRLFANEKRKNFFPKLKYLSLCSDWYSNHVSLGEDELTLDKIFFPESLLFLSFPNDMKPQYSHLKFLENLVNLEWLHLSPLYPKHEERENELNAHLSFDDYTSLAKLKSLRVLIYKEDGRDERVKQKGKDDDWKILSELKRLEILDFKGHQELSDLSFAHICTLTHLVYLNISYCSGVQDLSPLSKLSQLLILDTSQIVANTFPSGMKSLVVWNTFKNFGKFLEECQDVNLPSLEKLYIKEDETMTEKAISNIFHLPSLQVLEIKNCNLELDWLQSLPKATKLKRMEISECSSFKEYFKKKNILFSNEVEKDLARQALNKELKAPFIDADLKDFAPYLTEYFLMLRKKFEHSCIEHVELVRNFVMTSAHKGDELKREFGIAFNKHPANSLLFRVLYNISNPQGDPMEDVRNGFAGMMKKNWGHLFNKVLGSPKIFDFIPRKFHKLYLGVEVFLGPVWNTRFTTKCPTVERNYFTQTPALYLLLIIKRLKIFVPKPLIRLILSKANKK